MYIEKKRGRGFCMPGWSVESDDVHQVGFLCLYFPKFISFDVSNQSTVGSKNLKLTSKMESKFSFHKKFFMFIVNKKSFIV